MVVAKLFIASSAEGLPIGKAIQANFVHAPEVHVELWSQGAFEPSTYPLSALLKEARDTDYAAFVFSPDDTLTMRGKPLSAVRDNVLLEFGLFVAEIGLDHCFIVKPANSSDLHLPSDLDGIAPVVYKADQLGRNSNASLGPASEEIRQAIGCRGLADHKASRSRRFLDMVSGEWRLNYEHGKEKLAIDARGKYGVWREKSYRHAFNIEDIDYDPKSNTVCFTKVNARGGRKGTPHATEILFVNKTVTEMKGYSSPEGNGLRYMRQKIHSGSGSSSAVWATSTSIRID